MTFPLRTSIRWGSALLIAVICWSKPVSAEGASPLGPATEPGIHPTLAWIPFQLVPSPEIAFGDSGAHFGLVWQLTPVLYSFGIHRRLSPWRFFVVEPVVRQSGSIELFVSPEYLAIESELVDRFGPRVGVRSYFGLIHRGEYLSLSLGSSYFRAAGQDAVAYELGLYALYGVFGLQLAAAPGHDAARYVATFRFRFF